MSRRRHLTLVAITMCAVLGLSACTLDEALDFVGDLFPMADLETSKEAGVATAGAAPDEIRSIEQSEQDVTTAIETGDLGPLDDAIERRPFDTRYWIMKALLPGILGDDRSSLVDDARVARSVHRSLLPAAPDDVFRQSFALQNLEVLVSLLGRFPAGSAGRERTFLMLCDTWRSYEYAQRSWDLVSETQLQHTRANAFQEAVIHGHVVHAGCELDPDGDRLPIIPVETPGGSVDGG